MSQRRWLAVVVTPIAVCVLGFLAYQRFGAVLPTVPRAPAYADAMAISPAAPVANTLGDRDAVGQVQAESTARRPTPVVVVEDTRRKRIGAAEILYRESADTPAWRTIGVTDANGEFVSLPSAAEDAWVAARAPGYVAEAMQVSLPAPAPITLRLQDGASVCGLVVSRDGSPPRGTLRVIALPWMSDPEPAAIYQRMWSDDPCLASTATAPDGSFCIEGLDRGASYALASGGNGYAQLAPSIRAEPGDEGVRIEVTRLYAVRLHVGSAERAAADDPDFDTAPLTWWCEDERAKPEPIGLPTALAAGDPTIVGPSPGTRVRVFSSEVDADSVGLVHYTCSAPGYLEATGSCFALPIEQGGSHISLRLEPTAIGYGTVRLELVYEPSASQGKPIRVFPRGVLELRGPEDVRHRFVVPSSLNGLSEVRGVPVGTYRARFEALPSKAWFPADAEAAREIVVGEEPADVRLVLDGAGAIHLQLLDQGGGEYTAGIRVGVSYWREGGNPKGVGLGTFVLHAPHVLSGLREGTYSVTLYEPKATGRMSGTATEQGALERGTVATMEWVIVR